MNIDIIARFAGSGDPTIKIYKSVDDSLIVDSTMTETPESGVYKYVANISPLYDYYIPIEQGDDKRVGVYQSIFHKILDESQFSGGGGSWGLTDEQIEEIIKKLTTPIQEGLNKIEFKVNEEEIKQVIKEIGEKGSEKLEELAKLHKRLLDEEKKAQNLRFKEFKKESGLSVGKIEETLKRQQEMLNKANDAILDEMATYIDENSGNFSKMAKLLSAFRDEKKEESKKFAKLISAFRNEIIK